MTQTAKPRKLQVVDQTFSIIEDDLAEEKQKVARRSLKLDDLQQKRKTTIILSEGQIERIAELGRKGETYDNIINRVIDYDISLTRKVD